MPTTQLEISAPSILHHGWPYRVMYVCASASRQRTAGSRACSTCARRSRWSPRYAKSGGVPRPARRAYGSVTLLFQI
jgi:hypothetical protein